MPIVSGDMPIVSLVLNISLICASHFLGLDIAAEPHVPKDFWKAMAIPESKKAIDTELKKF